MSTFDPDIATADQHEHVHRAFPLLDEISDQRLQAGVKHAWLYVLVETELERLDSVPWFPPVQTNLGLEDATLVPHINAVAACADALTEQLREGRFDISRDMVLAGALIHDISKPFEYHGFSETDIGSLLGHPYYGIHIVEHVGLPTEMAHIVLSHTERTNVAPATLEAAIISQADSVAASALRTSVVDDLRDV